MTDEVSGSVSLFSEPRRSFVCCNCSDPFYLYSFVRRKPYLDRAAELKEEYKNALKSENNAQGAADVSSLMVNDGLMF